MTERESDGNRLALVCGLIAIVVGLTATLYSGGNVNAGYIASSERVSLSADGAIGRSYWKGLDHTVRASQDGDAASVLEGQANSEQSEADQDFRWNMLLSGIAFLITVGGLGCIKLSQSRKRHKRSQRQAGIVHDDNEGIASDEKSSGWVRLIFGGLLFVSGVALSLFVLPDAISEKEYVALFVLLFVPVGAGIVYHGLNVIQAYRRFGPTPLFLDPSLPGVGGQLGGRFNIGLQDTSFNAGRDTHLQAILTCIRKTKFRRRTLRDVVWHAEAPVFMKQTAIGVEATFLFDIPISCIPSKDWSQRSSIMWKVSVGGEFNNPDLRKFERSWKVFVDERATRASRISTVSQSFIETEKQNTEVLAEKSILAQVPVTEDARYVKVQALAGRNSSGTLSGILVGAIFAAIGVFTIQVNWFVGVLMALIGMAAAFYYLYVMGKSINVEIDKHSRLLMTQESWFGFKFAEHQSEIVSPDQIKIRKVSGSKSATEIIEIFVVEFTSAEKTIRIADGIEGKTEALALTSAIVDRCFK